MDLPIADAIDATWPQARPTGSSESAWRWRQILFACTSVWNGEAFAAQDGGAFLSAWATSTPLSARGFYVVDFLEVSPTSRRLGLGRWTFEAAILPRALALGARGVVLGSFPDAESFYLRLGLKRCPASLWSADRGFVPLWWEF